MARGGDSRQQQEMGYLSVDAPIVYSRSCGECNELSQHIVQQLRPALIGLDIEWRVTYELNSTQRTTAVLQVCTVGTVYVFHLSAMPTWHPTAACTLPPGLVALLEAPSIVKVGCKVRNDALKLQRDFGVRCAGLLELGALAGRALPYGAGRPWSLAELCSAVLHVQLRKDERMSNWEAAPLSGEQMSYAARDVFASRLVGVALLRRLGKKGGSSRAASMTSSVVQTRVEDDEVDVCDALRLLPGGLVEAIGMDAVERRRLDVAHSQSAQHAAQSGHAAPGTRAVDIDGSFV